MSLALGLAGWVAALLLFLIARRYARWYDRAIDGWACTLKELHRSHADWVVLVREMEQLRALQRKGGAA